MCLVTSHYRTHLGWGNGQPGIAFQELSPYFMQLLIKGLVWNDQYIGIMQHQKTEKKKH
jgi:hypothetical protein